MEKTNSQIICQIKKFLSLLIILVFFFSCGNPTSNDIKNEKPDKTEVSAEQQTELKHPEWIKNANIYEVNIRQYTKEGTFKAFESHLPRLKKMGVDILWIMPIHPVGEKKRKGTLGSYYAVQDYLAVNPEFGTFQDFKNLVESIHKNDMFIILDWVANHTAWDNPLIDQHPDWYKKDSVGNIISPVEDWSDVAGLNYENPALRLYMIDALKYWINEADIDGYRCDVAEMVPSNFWNEARLELDKIKEIFMLAEAENAKLHDNAFNMAYGWYFHHIMNEIAKGETSVNKIDNYFESQTSTYPNKTYDGNKVKFNKNTIRMYFTSNHDENSWNGTVSERLNEAVKTFAVLSYTIPGMPLIYSGQEAGLNKRLEFFNKDEIEWKSSEMGAFYTTLNKTKKENKALWNSYWGGELQRIKTTNDKFIFAFARQKEENTVFAIFNLSENEQEITFNCREFIGEYSDIFTNKKIILNENETIKLMPWEYRVYTKGALSR
jgi:glycosidase